MASVDPDGSKRVFRGCQHLSVKGSQALTTDELSGFTMMETKMMIAHRLYLRIEEIGAKEAHDPTELGVTDLAGKIAHMIVDLVFPNVYDLAGMLKNDSFLKDHIAYAFELLRKDTARQNARKRRYDKIL